MEKIDLVYMWVDGNDKKWLNQKFPDKSSFEK
ncbi:MAG: Stealth CR1 domain-containing protein [Alphaproteobacteria bacterium]|nr:Stealth CR1 domain-containing protein [Alphaproteobacteria bacterium]